MSRNNNQKILRGALSKIYKIAHRLLDFTDEAPDEMAEIQAIARNALTANDARNCDVGSVKEQHDRFMAFCDEHNCETCKLRDSASCSLAWSQLPFQ